MIVRDAGVFEIPGFLDAGECRRFVALAEDIGFETAGVGQDQRRIASVRNNDRVLIESPAWADALWERLRTHDLPVLDGTVARDFARMWRVYRYVAGQRFKMHRDGSVEERGMRSRLTFLIYLNDGFVGGETRFAESEWDFKRGSISIAPVAGKALAFVHERWHEGAPVHDGVKYALRTDLLYA